MFKKTARLKALRWRLSAVAGVGIASVVWAIFAAQPSDDKLIALGKALFFAEALSLDGSLSCASCHAPTLAYAQDRATSLGIFKRQGARNAISLLDVGKRPRLFWDGRAESLQAQAKMPLLNSIEMGQPNVAAVEQAVAADAALALSWASVFWGPPVWAGLAQALAAYQKTLQSGETPLERYLAGDATAISAAATRGWSLFVGRARCHLCHTPPKADGHHIAAGATFSDEDFHNIGIEGPASDDAAPKNLMGRPSHLGRFIVTHKLWDKGAFRTPSLRNVAATPPYMHDGSLKTLWDVMDHYNRGGDPDPNRDSLLVPLGLDEQQIEDLVALMFALTDAERQPLARTLWRDADNLRRVRPERDESVARARFVPR